MWKEVRERNDGVLSRYVTSTRHTIQVDYQPFMDELADMIGCKPDLCE